MHDERRLEEDELVKPDPDTGIIGVDKEELEQIENEEWNKMFNSPESEEEQFEFLDEEYDDPPTMEYDEEEEPEEDYEEPELLGEDEGDMNPFADDFEKSGLYGNETHPVVEASLLGENEGDLNPFADEFEEYGLYGKEEDQLDIHQEQLDGMNDSEEDYFVEPENETMLGEDEGDMNPFADDFDRYGIYGPDNVQCPAGKEECNFAPGKSECCKTGEFCIPNVGCRCDEPPSDEPNYEGKDKNADSEPVDIRKMYIVQ